MFCSHCGAAAAGNFCCACGSELVCGRSQEPAENVEPELGPTDWENDVCYERILRVEGVRAAISRHAASAPAGLSAEALLAIYDKIASPPVSFEGVVAVIQPLYAAWGIRTGKERTQAIHMPIGRAIASALCSVAKRGQIFESVAQGEQGCVMTATLPSSVRALKGELKISLVRETDVTQVKAATHIPGQIYDWGKSHQCLDRFFADLATDLGLPTHRTLPQAA